MVRFSTPVIPKAFREFEAVPLKISPHGTPRRWVNAFSDEFIGPNASNLYATETLFGDWEGRVLLLAQDALPARSLRNLLDLYLTQGTPRESAWHHAERGKEGHKGGFQTNELIEAMMKTYARGVGALYGSATAYMLYDNGTTHYSRSLPGLHDPRLRNHLRDVLRWVWGSMPNLKYVLCLGEVAWDLSVEAANLRCNTPFQKLRDGDRADDCLTGMVNARELVFIPSFHPAARCERSQKERGWRKLADAINDDKNA